MTRPKPYYRCTCGTKPCTCTWIIEVSRTWLFADWLVGMRYTVTVSHPGTVSVLENLYYANTRAGAVRKARRRIPVGGEVELVFT